jgi:ACS family D-galactonate transporter-like MFS transporter
MDYIREGGGLDVEDKKNKMNFNWAHFFQLLKNQRLIGVSIGQFAVSSSLFFFITWFPTYLVEAKHMSFLKVGFVASTPYFASFLGVLFGGFISDSLIRSGVSVSVSRKIPVIIGLLLTGSFVLANYVTSVSLIITVVAIASFAQGMSNISWALFAELAPLEIMGLAAGIFNFVANLGGLTAPLIVGFIVQASGSYAGALFYIAVVAIVGALSYVFIVGKVERIKLI